MVTAAFELMESEAEKPGVVDYLRKLRIPMETIDKGWELFNAKREKKIKKPASRRIKSGI
ncbi:MAG: hypothetical protein LBJ64_02065, partial [Deltaproteobacteria bacterium]|jgi:hypothetical protein|nr:hypothetical protein [Deltaproteobacteria bacterium]